MDAALDTHKFIAEYLKAFDARVAILVAGYKGKDPATAGQKLLQDPGIQNELLNVIQTRAQALADDTPDLFKKLWLIVSADIHELVQVTQGCCRYCWGKGFAYQRTPAEHREHLGKGGEDEGSEPYDRRKLPNPRCPECFGEGESRVRHTPSHLLSPAARALCAGYIQTKEGPRLKVHNQQRALELLVRYQNNWVKPKSPPMEQPYQSPEDKAREERIRKEWADGTWDPAAHAEREIRDSAKQSAARVEYLKQQLHESERQARAHAINVAALDALDAAAASTPSPLARGEGQGEGCAPKAHASDVDVIPAKAGIQAGEACAFAVIPSNIEESCLVRAAHAVASIPSPLARGEGQGEGCAPKAHAVASTPSPHACGERAGVRGSALSDSAVINDGIAASQKSATQTKKDASSASSPVNHAASNQPTYCADTAHPPQTTHA